jgi:hypothetical protein
MAILDLTHAIYHFHPFLDIVLLPVDFEPSSPGVGFVTAREVTLEGLDS